MAVHVGDILIAGSDEACRDFHAALNANFHTNNFGEFTWYILVVLSSVTGNWARWRSCRRLSMKA